MQDWRGALCAAILAATLAVSPSNAHARYCSPTCWESTGAADTREDSGPGLAWWGITAGLVLLAGLIGRSLKPPLPSKQDVRDAIDSAFKIRKDEADTHSKPKLTKPLDAAHKATIKALEKLGLA